MILASVPLWAFVVTFFAQDFGFLLIDTSIPLFLHDILCVSMTRNGIVSGTPYVASGVLTPLGCLLVDWLRFSGRLRTTLPYERSYGYVDLPCPSRLSFISTLAVRLQPYFSTADSSSTTPTRLCLFPTFRPMFSTWRPVICWKADETDVYDGKPGSDRRSSDRGSTDES